MSPPPSRPRIPNGYRVQDSSVSAIWESVIRPARAAGGSRTSRAGTRSQEPIRTGQSGSAGMGHPRQDGGRPPRRSLRNKPRSVSRGPRGPGAHSLLPQSDVWRVQAEAAAPGNGGGSVSSFPVPPRVPHPPGRSSPEVSTGVRQCL
ncbi:hypothetical protein NDU88_007415 [Pleurodeles waltl]|uniref:Uncharacterized protein n=1 Tax=Pleurodeles waltl TaxID=8319 RepID=A0AAV7UPA2_PLEWA|nr:hypothetical protein NDU88_007415 [Pleurodeles waltl]